MDRPRQRPTFEADSPLPLQTVVAALSAGLAQPDAPCEGNVTQRHAWVHVRQQDRHFWSPTLDLTLREAPDGTHLHGRFAPHPSIWTFFVFVYAALGLGACISATWGIAQLSLDRTPLGLALSVALLALIGFVYGAAFIGQGLGSTQMIEIRLFLERALAAVDRVEDAGDEPSSDTPTA